MVVTEILINQAKLCAMNCRSSKPDEYRIYYKCNDKNGQFLGAGNSLTIKKIEVTDKQNILNYIINRIENKSPDITDIFLFDEYELKVGKIY